MPDPIPRLLAANRFEKFARMRLEGKNDTIYRNYDLLSNERFPGTIDVHIRYIGMSVPPAGPIEVLTTLQRRFEEWGHGQRDLKWIKTLLREYYAYNKIAHLGKIWPLREPEDITRLYEENPSTP
jgi:hypothetical protein